MPPRFEGPGDSAPEVSGPDLEAGELPGPMTEDELARSAALRQRREVTQVRLNDLFGRLHAEPEPGIDCIDVPTGGSRLPYRLYMN